MKIPPIDIVRYILYKCTFYGDLVTNLKMQKLLYFVYAWHLVRIQEPIFDEKFQAWPSGPVLPSVYQELKMFEALPIDTDFSEIETEDDFNSLIKKLSNKKELIDSVYKRYGSLTAAKLVNITHQELAWQNARKDLRADEPSTDELLDDDILKQHCDE